MVPGPGPDPVHQPSPTSGTHTAELPVADDPPGAAADHAGHPGSQRPAPQQRPGDGRASPPPHISGEEGGQSPAQGDAGIQGERVLGWCGVQGERVWGWSDSQRERVSGWPGVQGERVLGLEGCGFTGFQVTGLRCSRFEKPVRSKKKRKTGFYRGHNYQYHAAGT